MIFSSSIVERRKAMVVLAIAFVVVLYILSAGGCDLANEEAIVKETNEPHYQRAMEELRRGNHQEALSAFLKVTEKRKDAPESHLEIGRIYLNNMEDPIFAIYHFRKFLELLPNSSISPNVRKMIETASKRYAASLPEMPYENNIRRLELEELWQKAQKENLELKQKLADAVDKLSKLESEIKKISYNRNAVQVSETKTKQQLPTPEVSRKSTQRQQTSADKQKPVVVRDIPSTYVVQPGDTFSTISRKFFGTRSRWKDIYKANRDRCASPESLRGGQTIRIPR